MKNTVSIIINLRAAHVIVHREGQPNHRYQPVNALTDYVVSLQRKYNDVSQYMNVLFYTGFSGTEKDQFEAYLSKS